MTVKRLIEELEGYAYSLDVEISVDGQAEDPTPMEITNVEYDNGKIILIAKGE